MIVEVKEDIADIVKGYMESVFNEISRCTFCRDFGDSRFVRFMSLTGYR